MDLAFQFIHEFHFYLHALQNNYLIDKKLK